MFVAQIETKTTTQKYTALRERDTTAGIGRSKKSVATSAGSVLKQAK